MPGKTLATLGTNLATARVRVARWLDTTLPGRLVEHAIMFIFTCGLYRVTYEVLHVVLPGDSPWTPVIQIIEGGTMTAIFLGLSYDFLSALWNRFVRGRSSNHDHTSPLVAFAI
jgi:hypothetical protein